MTHPPALATPEGPASEAGIDVRLIGRVVGSVVLAGGAATPGVMERANEVDSE